MQEVIWASFFGRRYLGSVVGLFLFVFFLLLAFSFLRAVLVVADVRNFDTGTLLLSRSQPAQLTVLDWVKGRSLSVAPLLAPAVPGELCLGFASLHGQFLVGFLDLGLANRPFP